MEQSIAKKLLEQIFNEVTSNESEFNKWKDYNLTEVQFPDLEDKIGIGLKFDNSAITLFYIEKVNYGPDYKKYHPTIRIGQAAALENKYWDIQLGYYGSRGVDIKDPFLMKHHESVAKPVWQKINNLEINC